MKPISNGRFILKPFATSHLDEFVVAVRESVNTVGVWMPWCRSDYPASDGREFFKNCQTNIENKSAYDIGIFMAEDDQLLGGISINRIDHQNKIGNIGYWIRESFQHQGIVSSAMELIKRFGFETLGLTRLEIIVLEHNLISRKVAEKCGAKFECIAANRLVHNGQAMPAAIYSLVPEGNIS